MPTEKTKGKRFKFGDKVRIRTGKTTYYGMVIVEPDYVDKFCMIKNKAVGVAFRNHAHISFENIEDVRTVGKHG